MADITYHVQFWNDNVRCFVGVEFGKSFLQPNVIPPVIRDNVAEILMKVKQWWHINICKGKVDPTSCSMLYTYISNNTLLYNGVN